MLFYRLLIKYGSSFLHLDVLDVIKNFTIAMLTKKYSTGSN